MGNHSAAADRRGIPLAGAACPTTSSYCPPPRKRFDRVWPADRQKRNITAARFWALTYRMTTRAGTSSSQCGTEPGDALARVGNLIVELARPPRSAYGSRFTSARPYDTAGIAG
jgi:hypothetical protein